MTHTGWPGRACVIAPAVVTTLALLASCVRPTEATQQSVTTGLAISGNRAAVLAAIGVDAGHGASGAGITLAVIDSGVDGDHPHLAGRVLAGQDVVAGGRGDTDGGIHGTAMASLAAGAGDANTAGAAPDATVLPVRAVKGLTVDAAGIAEALRWVVGRADVVLLAYGTQSWDERVRSATADNIAADAIVVVSAGNRSRRSATLDLPGALVVASVDERGKLHDYSGPAGQAGVVAPGGNDRIAKQRILAYGPGATPLPLAGTSVSAALAAGAVSMLRSAVPDTSAPVILDCIRASAQDLGEPGTDARYGHGQIDAAGALRCLTHQAYD